MRLVVVLLLVLAGCSSPPEAATTDDEPFDDLEGTVTDSTGLIRGVVVDSAIVPLAAATVRITGLEIEKTTNDQGAFVIDDLEPGTYFLVASKIGYNTTQTSVVVEGGVEKPDIVHIQLTSDAGSLPFYAEFVTKGFHTCATSAFTLCNFLDGLLCTVGECDILLDQTIMRIPIDQPPTWINSEEVWEPTQLLGQNFDFYLEVIDDDGGWSHVRSVAGGSPLLLTVDEAEAESLGFGTTNDLRHRTFPQLEDPTSAVFLNQDFTVYTHVFFNYAPPEGWRFTDNGDVPQPPT